MFTHQPVTPRRVETVIAVLRYFRKPLQIETLSALVQPPNLPDVTESSSQARDAVNAAGQLKLVALKGGDVELSPDAAAWRGTLEELVVRGLDAQVLASPNIEPYFARFYSFLLGLGKAGAQKRAPQWWADEFNRVANQGQLGDNPFNATKYAGLQRWYRYAGLGWSDPSGTLQCEPYNRIHRNLSTIFGADVLLRADQFFERLGEVCPELDGGELFRSANPNWAPDSREVTLGVSHALISLHGDRVIELDCPSDTSGWSIAAADPPRDGQKLRSSNVSYVSYTRQR